MDKSEERWLARARAEVGDPTTGRPLRRHADPTLPVEERIVAAELAIAQVAENAAAVREILRELVANVSSGSRPRPDGVPESEKEP